MSSIFQMNDKLFPVDEEVELRVASSIEDMMCKVDRFYEYLVTIYPGCHDPFIVRLLARNGHHWESLLEDTIRDLNSILVYLQERCPESVKQTAPELKS